MKTTTRRRSRKPRRGYLIDVEYDGDTGKAFLIFIDTERNETFGWFDKTEHTSYLYTDASESEIVALFGSHPEYIGVKNTVKYNAVLDKEVTLRRVFGKTPSAIPMFRGVLEDSGAKVWEAWVRYVNNYCYDTGLNIGMPYDVTEDKIVPVIDRQSDKKVDEVIDIITSNNVTKTSILEDWIKLFEYPLPNMKFTSLDIEVIPENPNILPNPKIPTQPVVAVGMVTTDGRKVIYILKRREGVMGEGYIDGEVEFFDTERDLLVQTFRFIREYPFVVTFNGDNFDMAYLYNRAKRLRIPSWNNPIYRDRMTYKLRRGIHIDLYPFFKNPSIQTYAFQAKYKDFGLDPISIALLGRGKIKNEKTFEWLTYMELGSYCLNDAELTLELLTFKKGITINLILSLVRMSNLTIYQVTRNRISDWVRSTFYTFSRKMNWLIPSQEELTSKGTTETVAKIDGKKYEGAIVRDMIPGVHFNVVVLDFASLYPSEVKKRNIGFSTINCKKGEEWASVPVLMKRLMWVMLRLYNDSESKWCQKEKMKLMKNIEKEVEKQVKNGEEKTENTQESGLENIINDLWTILRKREINIESNDLRHPEDGTTNSEMTRSVGRETKNIKNYIIGLIKTLNEMNTEDGLKLFGLNLSRTGGANVNYVGLMIQEFLKFTISTVIKDLEVSETVSVPWLMMTGKPLSSYAQTVIELLTVSEHWECESNKVPFTSHHICTKNRAIEADVIGGLRDARVYYYKAKAKDKKLTDDERAFYESLQQAIKVYINASYGVFGSESFAFFCGPVAESITAYGRRDMIAMMARAEETGIEVLGGDTDSTFLKNPTVEQTTALQQWAYTELDLDLGIDKVYRYVLFSHRKKNYLGIFEDGRADIKGLTGKKSHIPPIIKKGFFECTEILGKVHDMDEYNLAREELWKLVRELYLKIKDGEWDELEDLKFSTRLGKPIEDYDTNPQHVKAARMLQELGQPIAGGEIVEYIKANTEGGVVPLMVATNDVVDIDKYLEQLQTIFIQILEPMEIDWGSEIVGETKLTDFFGVAPSLLLSEFMKIKEELELTIEN